MLDGKPTVVISYSIAFQLAIATPVAQRLRLQGFRAVLVGDEPLPAGVESNPNSKVEWFFRHADLAVFLATPDDRLESGEVHTRQNIIDEHRLGQQLHHLSHRLMVFKAAEVNLPSNINPVYERLPQDDPDWIVDKVIEQARAWGVLPADEIASAPSPPVSPESQNEGPAESLLDDRAATGQATRALESAAAVLGGDPAAATSLQRAELAIAGLIAEAGGGDTLGVHLTNRLLADRHEIDLRSSERVLLLRSYLRHAKEDNVPGIFWIKDLTRSEFVDLLRSISVGDSNDEVRIQALRVLGRLGMPKASADAHELLISFIESKNGRLRSAAAQYLRDRRDPQLRDLLDMPELLASERGMVSVTAALIDVRRRPSDVMDRYVTDAFIRIPEVDDALVAAARRISRDSVAVALSSSVQAVRLFAIRMAVAKGSLSFSLGHALIEEDRSSRVRVAALRAILPDAESKAVDLVGLLDRAVRERNDDLTDSASFAETYELRLAVYGRLSDTDLATHISWASADGPECYEVMGMRSPEWAAQRVRVDLRNDFSALKKHSRDQIAADLTASFLGGDERELSDAETAVVNKSVDEHWQTWIDKDELGDFMTRMFQRAALRVICAWGKKTDIEFARRFVDSDDQSLQAEALRLIEKFGTSHDAAATLQLAGKLYEDKYRLRAAETALRLAYKKDKLNVLRQLREVPALSSWAIGLLADFEHGFDDAVELLRAPDADARLAACGVVWGQIRPDAAEEVLDIYMRGQHYYNVVRAVDRRLFAPSWLVEAVR